MEARALMTGSENKGEWAKIQTLRPELTDISIRLTHFSLLWLVFHSNYSLRRHKSPSFPQTQWYLSPFILFDMLDNFHKILSSQDFGNLFWNYCLFSGYSYFSFPKLSLNIGVPLESLYSATYSPREYHLAPLPQVLAKNLELETFLFGT